MNRQAQGMSINMIIIMALGLIVLIICIIMFVKQSDKGKNAIGSCLGGECVTTTECSGEFRPDPLGGTCKETGQICCYRTGTAPI